MNFILNVVLDQETDGKIEIDIDLFLKVFIKYGRFIKVDFAIKVFTQEDGPL